MILALTWKWGITRSRTQKGPGNGVSQGQEHKKDRKDLALKLYSLSDGPIQQ